jgi:hypothetical protein
MKNLKSLFNNKKIGTSRFFYIKMSELQLLLSEDQPGGEKRGNNHPKRSAKGNPGGSRITQHQARPPGIYFAWQVLPKAADSTCDPPND